MDCNWITWDQDSNHGSSFMGRTITVTFKQLLQRRSLQQIWWCISGKIVAAQVPLSMEQEVAAAVTRQQSILTWAVNIAVAERWQHQWHNCWKIATMILNGIVRGYSSNGINIDCMIFNGTLVGSSSMSGIIREKLQRLLSLEFLKEQSVAEKLRVYQRGCHCCDF